MYAKDLLDGHQPAATEGASPSYKFGPFILEATERALLREGEPVALTSKAFETLLVLVENSGRLVKKGELMERVWPDTFVEEKTLAQNVFTLRKVLGQDEADKYIETVPKHGYRFVAEVQVVSGNRRNSVGELKSFPVDSEAQISARLEESPSLFSLLKNNREDVRTESEANANYTGSPDLITHEASIKTYTGMRIGVAALIFLVVGAAALYGLKNISLRSQPVSYTSPLFRSIKMKNLTTNGKASIAVVSADGKYIAYAKSDSEGEQSLWVHQIATASETLLLPANQVTYWGLRFTPDGNYVYYTVYEGAGNNLGTLYKIPVLGGTPKRLVVDIDSPVTFSPDGQHIAFVRGFLNSERWSSALMIARMDGTEERQLALRANGDFYSYHGPDWSPDGTMLACAVGSNRSRREMSIVGVKIADGSEKFLTERKWWTIERLVWLADGSGILFNGADYGSEDIEQIWHLSYPTGEIQRITNDLNNYIGVSTTPYSKSIVTLQLDHIFDLMVAPNGDTNRAQSIPTIGGKFGLVTGFSWTPEGRVVYGSNEKGNSDIWIAEVDGQNKQQLTVDEHLDHSPAVSPDGRHIAFLSNRSGNQQLWVMDINGDNQRQLTHGPIASRPAWSPDGRWIVYTAYSPLQTIWRVPSDGGAP
ncbi:MAG TPA: LpqB family beta-propeller domain-containing protein, partial [Pyrinomonadaceae bacterium]|nr:LpqB family beta-propeller domain-containing protein [Pyrinomonadaceae bacterium]